MASTKKTFSNIDKISEMLLKEIMVNPDISFSEKRSFLDTMLKKAILENKIKDPDEIQESMFDKIKKGATDGSSGNKRSKDRSINPFLAEPAGETTDPLAIT